MMYLTNTPVVLPADDIAYHMRKMSARDAFIALGDGFTSAIGHQGTVDVLKAIFPGLASRITLNRIEIKEPSSQIVFKLKGRLPEGKVLNKDEIEAIGYEFWSVTPVKEKIDPAPRPVTDRVMIAITRRKIGRKCKTCNFFTLDKARSYDDTHDYYYKCLLDEKDFDHDDPTNTVCDQHKYDSEK